MIAVISHYQQDLPRLILTPMHVRAVINHYKENECMRLAMEDLLYNNGVDIIFNGHCHEYERSNPVYVSVCLT